MEPESLRIIPPPGSDFRLSPTFNMQLVRNLDRIRFELPKAYPDGEMDEVAWFLREYPRAYRYHLACADFRLETIAQLYQELHRELAAKITKDVNLFEVSQSDRRVQRIYWDFESFLTEIGISLDLLARIAGAAYKNEMPPSFSRFCRKTASGDAIVTLFQAAQMRWINDLKDYRDCFMHYTPVDTMLSICMVRRKAGWQTRCKIPGNPNEREILRFRFPWRVELLRYAFSVRRNMHKLDASTAAHIDAEYKSGNFPLRKQGLFSVGRRERT